MPAKEELISAYSKKSKHSNYQVLPSSLKKILGDDGIKTRTRFERERLDYLLKVIDFSNKDVLDIGGNTGYFTFELINNGAQKVTHYEGNKEHSEFVKLAADALGLTDRVATVNNYFSFDGDYREFHDVILLFNVLHHTGDDYGEKIASVESAKAKIATELNNLAGNCRELVFQMGFNWHGNTAQGIFEDGTKKQLIDFVKDATKDTWVLEHIGIPVSENGKIVYKQLDETNIARDDSLGEFLNRPIFILKPKVGI